jgi:ubiquinone/menaquinone biosynthesis C-methylase UbiE
VANPLPERRYTDSRDHYWRDLFNAMSAESEDHAISGWSRTGLLLRLRAYTEVLPLLQLPEGALVLDLGSGSGVYSRMLSSRGYRVVAADFASGVLAKARERNGPSGAAGFVSGDACRLPFAGGVFDHVVCIGLFQSLERSDRALGESIRTLKPGGSICLMTLNRRELKTRIGRALGRDECIVVNGRPRPRLETYDPSRLAGQMRAAGFQRLSVRPVQIYPEGMRRLAPLVNLWSRIPVAGYLTARSFMVLGRKANGKER